jgi:gas vesicle protein
MKIRPLAGKAGNWLAAGAIGAGVSLLFAPHSGRVTRRIIRRKAQEYIEDARNEVAEKTEDLYVRGKQAAEHTARTLRRKLSAVA